MNFGENIQFLRKQSGMTQEELAEKMNVSRQTVSKWEAGSIPEMERLTQLCDLFRCDLDTLIRGNASDSAKTDSVGYDRHMNTFALQISSGVALILLGITVLLLLQAFGIHESFCAMLFLCFIAASVVLFIVGGLRHGAFVKKHPDITPFYSQEQIDNFNKRFPLCIAIPVAAILLGVAWIIIASEFTPIAGMTEESFDMIITAPFMFIIACSTFTIVYSSMLKSKYNIEEYNRENDPRRQTFADKLSGCIMLAATIAFLLMGWLGNLWHPGWVVFPIGGILCGIVDILKKNTDD